MPLGQMPMLEYNGTKLPQSSSIARFLAKQFHLAGKDNLEQAKVDAVVDTINDVMANYFSLYVEKDEEKRVKMMTKFVSEDLPKALQNLETLAKHYSNGGSFFVGNALTWADLLFYDVAQSFLAANGDALNNFPWLTKNRQEVENQPRIAQYLKQRPVTAF